jgi:hypothetical protein
MLNVDVHTRIATLHSEYNIHSPRPACPKWDERQLHLDAVPAGRRESESQLGVAHAHHPGWFIPHD